MANGHRMVLQLSVWLVLSATLVHSQGYRSASYQCAPTPVLPTSLRVIAIPDPFFVAANATTGTKNSGFLVELLDKLQAISGLPYTLTARPDLNYGTQNPNGTWDGSIIGALVNNTSKDSVAQAICANILDSGDKGLVFDDDAGLATVLTGNFAYLGGSPFLDSAVARKSGQGSPLREKLNIALLQLFESGEVQSLFTKYGINN
ncbi:hypothetical protein BV898_13743 [Hypsibius exemplaris]|uniref:Ionotropic glutamate receptor L-glutamate and glycine-binding domain-containing protein n=1 Tax=Hypsibius exemplaris TaxID=2072580 RepID=A0A1W0W9V6_HYPEX|nr:hypothetical protein BV898_13743 [Hypsibius exemplaris]